MPQRNRYSSSLVTATGRQGLLLGVLVVLALMAMPACTEDDTDSLRLALPSDPIWEWLKDSGRLSEWENRHDVSIEVSHPFDLFSPFAGGHADIVVINALDVTRLADHSDRAPIIIGKYTIDYSILAVQRTSRAETLPDLAAGALSNRAEGKIAVANSTGSTLLWGLIANELYDLDFNIGSEHFNLVVVEPASIPDLVTRSDVSGCICEPDFTASYLANDKLKILYDGRPASVIYADEVIGDPAALPVGHVFVADAEWYSLHKDEAYALLDLWDEGLKYWNQNKSEIIATYPHMFSVESEEEIAWLIEYAQNYDWVFPTTRLSTDDWNTYTALFKRMQAIELISTSTAVPRMEYQTSPTQVSSQDSSGSGENGNHEESGL